MDDRVAIISRNAELIVNELDVDARLLNYLYAMDIIDKQQREDIHEYYQLTSILRGVAIILNNDMCRSGRRHGTEVDAKNLVKLYAELGFQVEEWGDLDATNIRKKMDELTERKMPGDAFIFTILSHGEGNYMKTIDEESLDMDEEIFAKISQISSLRDKPKLIFIESGRREPIVKCDSAACPAVAKKYGGTDFDYKDFFVMRSTLPGQHSYRNTVIGSWFVRALIHSFLEKCHNGHLDDIATQTATRMEAMHETGMGGTKVTQIPQKMSSLTKQLYFLPHYP